jgi:hypothetical protein
MARAYLRLSPFTSFFADGGTSNEDMECALVTVIEEDMALAPRVVC